MPDANLIAIASLALNVIIALIGLTWGVRSITAKITEDWGKELDHIKLKYTEEMNSLHTSISEAKFSTERMIGETGSALRTKITEVELHLRDNYTRRDTFQKMIDMLLANITSNAKQTLDAIRRLEDKIDLIKKSD